MTESMEDAGMGDQLDDLMPPPKKENIKVGEMGRLKIENRMLKIQNLQMQISGLQQKVGALDNDLKEIICAEGKTLGLDNPDDYHLNIQTWEFQKKLSKLPKT